MNSDFERALKLHSSGALDAAAEVYSLAVQSDRLDGTRLHHYAVCLWQLGRVSEALLWFERALELRPNDPAIWSNFGHFLVTSGSLERGLGACLEAVRLAPSNITALTNLGSAYRVSRNFELAIATFQHAVNISPNDSNALANLASIFLDLSRWSESQIVSKTLLRVVPQHIDGLICSAVSSLELGLRQDALIAADCAVSVAPGDPRAWLVKGRVLHSFNRLGDALDCLDKSLSLRRDFPFALSAKGSVLVGFRRHEDALACFERLISLEPRVVSHRLDTATTLLSLNRPVEARIQLSVASRMAPTDPILLGRLGDCYRELGDQISAIDHYKEALTINPDMPAVLNNLGSAYHKLGALVHAVNIFDGLLRANPRFVEATINRGVIAFQQGDYDYALFLYRRAIDLDSDRFDVWRNLGDLYFRLKRYEDALASYKTARGFHQSQTILLDVILHTSLKICDWSEFDNLRQALHDAIAIGSSIYEPFNALGFLDDPHLTYQVARLYSNSRFSSVLRYSDFPRVESVARGVIRVGYFSADFHCHATAYLTAQLFESHDRDSFEIHAFSFGPRTDDPMQLRLKKSFDVFHDVHDFNNLEIAELSRRVGIDIAVDLKGYTLDARPGIFSLGAAPIQVSYLGFPGTLGCNFIDYIIADEIVIPAEDEHLFSESVVRMPDSYQVNDATRSAEVKAPSRDELGISGFKFVYCCFNNSYKILPNIFAAWMEILRQVPDSCLWLLDPGTAGRRNLVREASHHGITERRLIFAAKMPLDMHLSRHQWADLFLDTTPYNAHTTASDALRAGLPILTIRGATFSGRVAESLLSSLGMSNLVCADLESYVASAVDFGKFPEKIAALKTELSSALGGAVLFDGKRFAQRLELAFRKMVEDRDNGLSPSSFHVRE